MSLIVVEQQVRGSRTRMFVVLIGAIAAIIAGLLAMHSLNTHGMPAGHSDVFSTGGDPVADGGHHHITADAVVPAAAPACADCGDDHQMAWAACVLALLVGVIVWGSRRARWRIPSRATASRAFPGTWSVGASRLPPPSLVVLCISRT